MLLFFLCLKNAFLYDKVIILKPDTNNSSVQPFPEYGNSDNNWEIYQIPGRFPPVWTDPQTFSRHGGGGGGDLHSTFTNFLALTLGYEY